MGIKELRNEAHSFIDRANDKTLKKVIALAKSHEDKEVDHTLPGSPMDVETYRKRLIEASDRVKAGHYTTSEDLEKEMEQW